MSDPRRKLKKTVRTTLTKRGDALEGVINATGRAKDAKPKQSDRSEWDDALADQVATMAEGNSVVVEVTIDLAENGKRTVRLAGVGALTKVRYDAERVAAVQENGFINPYTFVPTLPRSDQDGSRLADTGLDDDAPPSHALHADSQWSGTLALTLTTVTPLLLPVPAADPPRDGPKTFDVRVDANGQPLIHGASLKGALRSAYETVTASRFGVFAEHHERLAYRASTNAALHLTPARVHRDGDTTYFRLCQGDADWRRRHGPTPAQYAALVPAYQGKSGAGKPARGKPANGKPDPAEPVRPVRRLGSLSAGPLSRHHGTEVYARVVLPKSGGKGGVSRATHLARTEAEIHAHLQTAVSPEEVSGSYDADRPSRIVRGWLSASGNSIEIKQYERLFVETPGLDIPVTEEHVRYWQSVLRAYDLAQGYNDPKATYRHDPATADGIERSWHVPSTAELRTLPPGTLVYVRYDPTRKTISEVHPVLVGRLPFEASPDELLHESLRPAPDRDRLSPADRLFGWVPPSRRDDEAETTNRASGYRGRLRVRSITCTTPDWRPTNFPPQGVTLAPLSSPKPTQFRFYGSPNPRTGEPMPKGAEKSAGYTADGGLRGRKMYRWRAEEADYWQPPADREDPKRGYLALTDNRSHPTQLVRHRGWVRPGATFQVELFLDGVPEAELGALIWLLNQGEEAPLRLGAGKPYGFGVVTARLAADRTRVWDGAGVRAGWLHLSRPDPVSPDRLTKLAEHFAATARENEVLREAGESYLAAARAVNGPVHYPRPTKQPQAESYQWFVENEKSKDRRWALPHVRDDEQRLPYLDSRATTEAQASSPKIPAQGRPAGKRGRQRQRRS